jgi:ABC-2 type transport system permease protein
MNEALLGVSANGEKFSDVILHLRFLLFFATLTLVCGWISYRRMLMVEKRL